MRHLSTGYTERQNRSMRMGMRRFTPLTNAFFQKTQNHEHAVALYFMHYNFVRIHKSLHVTPAMEAGVTDRPWEVEDIVGLVDTPRLRKRSQESLALGAILVSVGANLLTSFIYGALLQRHVEARTNKTHDRGSHAPTDATHQ